MSVVVADSLLLKSSTTTFSFLSDEVGSGLARCGGGCRFPCSPRLVTVRGTNIAEIPISAHRPRVVPIDRGVLFPCHTLSGMALRVVYSSRLLRIGRSSLNRSYSIAWCTQRVAKYSSLGSNLRYPRSSLSPSTYDRCVGRDRQSYYYSTSSSDGGGEEKDEGEGEETEESGGEEEAVKNLHQQFALTPVSVPDIFPEVPVLPVSRNPIFPKFVKMLEVRVHHTHSFHDNKFSPAHL